MDLGFYSQGSFYFSHKKGLPDFTINELRIIMMVCKWNSITPPKSTCFRKCHGKLNENPIPYEHGFPLRLVVPGWYGMASVKWLREIQVIDKKFEGPFQTLDYVYYPHKYDDEGAAPVTVIKINSIIAQPQNYSLLDLRTHEISGIAWTGGNSAITDVELSFDNGSTWNKANLQKRNYVFAPSSHRGCCK